MTGRKKWCESALDELDRQGLIKLVEDMIKDTEVQIERLK